MNRLTRIGVAAALAAATTLAISQGAPNPAAQAKTAVEARQSIFRLIGNQSGPLGAMNRPNAPAPDLAMVARNAGRIQMLADMIPEMFANNVTPEATVKTRALPVIWTGMADFKSKAEGLSKAAGALAAAAKSGDAAATKTAAGEINKACSACHDTYRGPVVP